LPNRALSRKYPEDYVHSIQARLFLVPDLRKILMPIVSRRQPGALLARLLPLLLVFGCASFVAGYDPASRDRITAISTEVLGLYQELISTPFAARGPRVMELQPRYDRIETDLRVHRLLEQARPGNEEGVLVTDNLLTTIGNFRRSQLSGQPDALATANLMIERQQLERQLGAALMAEDARQLAGGGEGGGT
jgi:hypothetical protein